MANFYFTGKILENSAQSLMAHVLDDNGDLIQAADIDTIAVKVFDRADNTEVTSDTLLPEDAIFSSLQTDAKWTEDNEGYNFICRLSGDNFPEGDTVYRVEIKITPFDDEYGSSSPFYLIWDLQCQSVLSE